MDVHQLNILGFTVATLLVYWVNQNYGGSTSVLIGGVLLLLSYLYYYYYN